MDVEGRETFNKVYSSSESVTFKPASVMLRLVLNPHPVGAECCGWMLTEEEEKSGEESQIRRDEGR